MIRRIKKLFYEVLVNSLTTQQVKYLGEFLDATFDLYHLSGFSYTQPIPRQTAVDTLMLRFSEEDDFVRMFSIMLMHEGERFYNRELAIWGRDKFISLLKLNKWVFDPLLKQFFRDPFYEHEINFLKKIQLIDLRSDININNLITEITAISSRMGIRDLEWRVAIRLYDLDSHSGELIRKIMGLLLVRQELQEFTGELFFCFKELAINASKANYKLLFEKYISSKQGIAAEEDYSKFLELFRHEIEENGNSKLLKLAKKDNRFYTITFQSTIESIEVWVTNTQNITLTEKKQILKKLAPERLNNDNFFNNDDEHPEGAGLGLTMILSVLKKYSSDINPLKVVFYPDFIKIGFELKRSEIKENLTAEG